MIPKITVITPTYNRANLLPKTIDSVLSQTVGDFEYYIIDDGSSDNTREVVEPYLSDERIHYIFQENAGEPAAVNHGWSLAKGEYFVQINSDDPALPELFEEMILAMDSTPQAIVGYCDFYFIDDSDMVIHANRSVDWDFHKNLSDYSCVAAAPGTFFRRSGPLSKWKKLRRNNYKHINDIEMYWDMALEGDFVHVPKILATWREHPGQISYARYESIDEIKRWFAYYFDKPDLRDDVLACREACKKSILAYAISLISQSSLDDDEKLRRIYELQREDFLNKKIYSSLQVGDNDLIGNKFNGHDLHLLLEKRGINAWHIVRNKESNDKKTVALPHSDQMDFSQQILRRKEFLLSDIVHLHLIHNSDFDIKMLPLLTRMKPTIITLHDPFFLGGHCIYHFNCEKWKIQCSACSFLNAPFSLAEDDSALRFAMKERYFQDSEISVIVASDWMKKKVEQSPIFEGKKIYKLPFGVDQSMFVPADTKALRLKFHIPAHDIVLFFRSDPSKFKGLETIKAALRKLAQQSIRATILTVGQTDLLKEFEDDFNILEFGWLRDDNALVELYQASDLFLMPSDQEAFGMMAIEAMSCGKMVLAVPGTSLESIIGAPECGMLVTKKKFADELLSLVQNRSIIAERGRRSLTFARERYNLDKYIDGMVHIYSDVMERFEPSPKSTTVFASLLLLQQQPESLDFQYTLCNTHSWKITKPLRAFFEMMRAMKRGPLKAIKLFFIYLKNEDCPPDEEIRNSSSWKITAPLRAIRMFFTAKK